jgi:hypothetical protein
MAGPTIRNQAPSEVIEQSCHNLGAPLPLKGGGVGVGVIGTLPNGDRRPPMLHLSGAVDHLPSEDIVRCDPHPNPYGMDASLSLNPRAMP